MNTPLPSDLESLLTQKLHEMNDLFVTCTRKHLENPKGAYGNVALRAQHYCRFADEATHHP